MKKNIKIVISAGGRGTRVPEITSGIGNIHTHLAVLAKIDNILAYVYKYAKNNKRRKVEVGIACL